MSLWPGRVILQEDIFGLLRRKKTVWHKRYSLGFTEVFGQVACLTCSPILGCGQAERNRKEYKNNLGGKRAKLAPEKAKKLSVISASYSHKRCEACHNRARRADVLFNDEDFK